MSRRLPSLNALRAFESAGRHLSFSRAAEELFVTQGAISRQVKSLEDMLGLKLFRRMTRAIELTERGREYLPTVCEAFDRLEQATIRLSNKDSHSILTVSVLPTFAMRWLIPRLPNFVSRHPNVEVRMITSIRPVNFWREDIDLAIRVGLPPEAASEQGGPRISLQMADDWTDVRTYRLMPDVLVPVCSRSLLDRHAPIRTPADLQRVPLLHMASRAHAWPDWFKAAGVPFRQTGEDASYGHFFLVLDEALQGNGVALVPLALAEADIASGRLVIPVDFHTESAGAYYVLCRNHQAESKAIQVFRDWLMAERDRPAECAVLEAAQAA
jgi:LysR family glycine cleavage system transcriptional activator